MMKKIFLVLLGMHLTLTLLHYPITCTSARSVFSPLTELLKLYGNYSISGNRCWNFFTFTKGYRVIVRKDGEILNHSLRDALDLSLWNPLRTLTDKKQAEIIYVDRMVPVFRRMDPEGNWVCRNSLLLPGNYTLINPDSGQIIQSFRCQK